MENVVELIASFEFVVGVASSMLVAILAYLVRPSVDGARKNWNDRQRRTKELRRRHNDALVQEARSSERMALSHALHEVRTRLRAHTWLLLSFFTSSLGAFTLLFYVEIESAPAVPRILSLGLVGVMMGAIVFFVFSLSEERAASYRTGLVRRILEEQAESGEAFPSSSDGLWVEHPLEENESPNSLGVQVPFEPQRRDDLRADR